MYCGIKREYRHYTPDIPHMLYLCTSIPQKCTSEFFSSDGTVLYRNYVFSRHFCGKSTCVPVVFFFHRLLRIVWIFLYVIIHIMYINKSTRRALFPSQYFIMYHYMRTRFIRSTFIFLYRITILVEG